MDTYEEAWNNSELQEYRLQYVGQELPIDFKKGYFSKQVVDLISRKITQILTGVHPEGKNIVVPDTTILHIMNRVFDNQRNNTVHMIDMVIEIITSRIRDEFEINQNNEKLSKWITKYDEEVPNEPFTAIRAHGPIKIRNKHPQYMMFFFNY
jgi:hypothetical protein